MPGWLKALLIVVALLFVGVAVVAFIAYRSISSRVPEMRAAAEKMKTEGAAYGKGRQPADCIEEALRRADRTFTGQITTRIFVDACLRASTPPPGWCDQVPEGMIAEAKWANTECIRRNLAGDQTCVAIYTGAAAYCHPPH